MVVEQGSGEGFGAINRAIIESNLVPRLHGILTQHGVSNIHYLIFDATEVTAGFPTIVNTRYILPVSDDLELFSESEVGPSVGLAVEQFTFSSKVAISIGLSRHKIREVKPDWWIYYYDVTDVTRPHSFDESFPLDLDGYVYGNFERGIKQLDDLIVQLKRA